VRAGTSGHNLGRSTVLMSLIRHVRVSSSLWAAICAEAGRLGISASELIRAACVQWLRSVPEADEAARLLVLSERPR
jgi:hypothetical protein